MAWCSVAAGANTATEVNDTHSPCLVVAGMRTISITADDDILQQFSERVRKLRKACDWCQERFAAQIGLAGHSLAPCKKVKNVGCQLDSTSGFLDGRSDGETCSGPVTERICPDAVWLCCASQ